MVFEKYVRLIGLQPRESKNDYCRSPCKQYQLSASCALSEVLRKPKPYGIRIFPRGRLPQGDDFKERGPSFDERRLFHVHMSTLTTQYRYITCDGAAPPCQTQQRPGQCDQRPTSQPILSEPFPSFLNATCAAPDLTRVSSRSRQLLVAQGMECASSQ